jgi:hypothetical protein
MPSGGRKARSVEIHVELIMELTFDAGVRVTILHPWSERNAVLDPVNIVDWPHYVPRRFYYACWIGLCPCRGR